MFTEKAIHTSTILQFSESLYAHKTGNRATPTYGSVMPNKHSFQFKVTQRLNYISRNCRKDNLPISGQTEWNLGDRHFSCLVRWKIIPHLLCFLQIFANQPWIFDLVNKQLKLLQSCALTVGARALFCGWNNQHCSADLGHIYLYVPSKSEHRLNDVTLWIKWKTNPCKGESVTWDAPLKLAIPDISFTSRIVDPDSWLIYGPCGAGLSRP